MCRLVEELQAQVPLRLGGLGYNEQAGGVFVDTVHQAHLGVVGVVPLKVAQMPCHGVDKRAVVVAAARMDHHAGGLVDDHQLGVLVDDVERDVLGLDGVVVMGPVEHEGHHVARADLVVAFYGAVVDMHKTSLCRLLNAAAAGVCEFLAEIFVNAQGHLPFVHHETVVLIELWRLAIELLDVDVNVGGDVGIHR